MGYSARYHTASLIAVFLALAIGILIGAEFGGDALTNTRRDLEHSLVGNLQDARSHADELNADLNRSNEFGERVYPVLTRDRLTGRRLAIVALGALAKTRFADLRTNPDALSELGTGLGRQLVLGGTLPEVVRGQLFSRASGSFGGLDGVIVVRDQPEDMGPVQRSRAGQFESALMSGMTATRVPAVGIEATATEPSSISFFQSNDLASIDDIDLTAGQLALVFSLLGAEGSFGVKGSADRLLPDLLTVGR